MPSDTSVRELVEAALQPTFVEVKDVSEGCGAKFDLIVVSAAFEGKPLIARHRLVNNALSSVMGEIHALTMKTWTPEQYAAKQSA